MHISREEFDKKLTEGQDMLLSVLANSSEVSVDKFYKVANILEYVAIFSGVIYTVISIASENSAEKKKLPQSNKTNQLD